MNARKVFAVLIVASLFMMIQITPNLFAYFRINSVDMQSEFVLSAPTGEQWEMTFGGSEDDKSYDILEVPGEGFVAVGETSSFGDGSSDAWLVFLDEMGVVLNNLTYGTPIDDAVYDIIKVSTGGYAMVGRQGPTGSCDLWLLLVDDFGGEIGTSTYSSGVADYGEALIETSDGCFLMTGWSSNGTDYDMLLTKVNATTGIVVWSFTYGGNGMDIGYEVIETSDGYVVVGETASWGEGGEDMWLVKVDFGGLHLWNKTYGTNWWESGYSLTHGISSGFALAGITQSDAGFFDAWLVFTDNDGNEISNHTYGGSGDDSASSISQTRDNDGYVLTGDTNSFGVGSQDFYTIRTDTNGVLVWDISNGSLLWDHADSITYLSDGGFIITGYTEVGGSDWDMRANRLWVDTEGPDFTNLPASVQFDENEFVSFQVLATEYSGYRYWQLNDTRFSVTNFGLITNATTLGPGVFPVRVTAMDKYYNMNGGDVTFTIGEEITTTTTTSSTTTTTTTVTNTTTTTPTNTTTPIDPEADALQGLGWVLMGVSIGSAGLAMAGLYKLKKYPFRPKEKK